MQGAEPMVVLVVEDDVLISCMTATCLIRARRVLIECELWAGTRRVFYAYP